MTTLVDIRQATATLTGTGKISVSASQSASLNGSSSLRATVTRISGGVNYQEAVVNLRGTGSITAPAQPRRAASANLRGVGKLRRGEGAVGTLRLTVLGGNAYGDSRATLPLFSVRAADPATVPEVSSSSSTLPLRMTVLGGSGSYAGASTVFGPLFGLASDAPADGARYLTNRLVAYDGMAVSQDVSATMQENWTFGQTVLFEYLISLDISNSLTMAMALQSAADFGLSALQVLTVVDGFLREAQGVAWVVNNNAQDRYGKKIYPNSMYANYGFTALGKFKGKYYGVKPDGIYELVGETDNAAPILASVLTGRDDYGNAMVKQMQFVYADMQADADLALTVRTDNLPAYTYALPKTATMRNSRAVLGRGLRARHWQLQITNPGGAGFTLNAAEVMNDATTRRLK